MREHCLKVLARGQDWKLLHRLLELLIAVSGEALEPATSGQNVSHLVQGERSSCDLRHLRVKPGSTNTFPALPSPLPLSIPLSHKIY